MLNRKGYTIVEGIIAMLLIAIMVGAIFSALMASRRAIVEPSYREEMFYAVESLANTLKNYVDMESGDLPPLCGSTTPLSYDEEGHDCSELLPDVCKTGEGYDSSLKYYVTGITVSSGTVVNQVRIHIVCNGEVL